MIVVPGVVFDRSFSRLGYGKGFYDRFLSTYCGIASNVLPPLVNTSTEERSSTLGTQLSSTDPSAISEASRRPIPILGVYRSVI